MCRSSDLSRAKETAQIIASYLGNQSVELDARLRESNLGNNLWLGPIKHRFVGDWQGELWENVRIHRPVEVMNRLKSPDYRIPNAETNRERFARVCAALTDTVLSHVGNEENQAIVIVTHGGPLDDIARMITCTPFDKGTGFKKLNTTICELHCSVSPEIASSIVGLAPDSRRRLIDQECEAIFPAASVDPANISSRLAAWRIIKWGMVEHLREVQVSEHAYDSKI